MRSRQHAVLAAALAALLAACSDAATEPRADALTRDEVESLGAQLDVSGTVGADGAVSFRSGSIPVVAFGPGSTEFNRTVNCPAGGTLAVKGTVKAEGSREARTMKVESQIVTTPSACAHAVRGAGGATLAVTGSPSLTTTAVHEIAPAGVKSQTRETGGFTWTRSSGESGSCQLDVTSTLDMTTRIATRKGTYCGRTIDETRTLPAPRTPQR